MCILVVASVILRSLECISMWQVKALCSEEWMWSQRREREIYFSLVVLFDCRWVANFMVIANFMAMKGMRSFLNGHKISCLSCRIFVSIQIRSWQWGTFQPIFLVIISWCHLNYIGWTCPCLDFHHMSEIWNFLQCLPLKNPHFWRSAWPQIHVDCGATRCCLLEYLLANYDVPHFEWCFAFSVISFSLRIVAKQASYKLGVGAYSRHKIQLWNWEKAISSSSLKYYFGKMTSFLY